MNDTYALALGITACICAVIALIAWKRRAAPGAIGLMLFMLSEVVWASTYAVRWMVTNIPAQLFWLDMTYFGVAFHTTFLIIFVLQFTNRSHLLTLRNLALLGIVPIATLLLLWTDDLHRLFYGGIRTTGTILNGGPWFWFFVIYAYIQIFITIALYIQAFSRSSGLYRLQTGAILLAACLPVIGNVLSLAGFRPFPNLDITPFIFTASGLIYAYGLFGFQLLDVLPVARDRLVEEMADGILVFDAYDRLVDANPAARRLIGISANAIGKPAGDLLNTRLRQNRSSAEINLTELRLSDSPVWDIEIQSLPLLDRHQNIGGRLLILREITERKQTEAALRESETRFRNLFEDSPISLWEEDFSAVKRRLDDLRAGGVQDFNTYFNQHPEVVAECVRLVQVLDVNKATLTLYGAASKEALIKSLATSLPEAGNETFRDELVMISAGKTHFAIEMLAQTMNGKMITVNLNWAVIPGHEGDLSRVIVSIIDITERKQAEAAITRALSILESTMESTADGILVADGKGRIVLYNQKFRDMWNIPETIVAAKDDNAAISFVLDQLRDPETFLKTVRDLYNAPQETSFETLELQDGRVFERYSQPQMIGDFVAGRVWSFRDVSERKKAEDALQSNQAFLSQVIENSGVSIFVKDRDGRYTLVNGKWEGETGYKREFAIGKTDQDLFPEHQGEEFRKNDLRVMQEVVAVKTEEEIESADGKRFFVTIKLPMQDKDNVVTGICGISTEITDLKRAAEQLREAHDRLEHRVAERTAELQAANIRLEKAARMKDEFLASMSHELRTPLTGILGLSEVMQMPGNGPLTEKQKTYLGHIHTNGKHLLELINDILDLSKIEAGKLELTLAPCSLAEICQASLQMIFTQASAKSLHSSLSISPDEIIFKVDARRIKQIIINLLSNAVKFTPPEGSFGVEVLGDSVEKQVRITVWDTGIGIKEEDIPRLFQSFVQLDARLARQYSGTGLGLALVRRLAELHGGNVLIQSVIGQGSRFTVVLPWEPA